MKSTRLFATLTAAAIVFAAPMAVLADGPAWWDPFNLMSTAKPTPSTARKPVTTARKSTTRDSSWLKLPGFGTSEAKTAKKPAARRSSEPSTLEKMNSSTKRFFSNAKDSLTFGDKKKTTSTRPTGYGAGGGEKRVSRDSKTEKEPSGNILTSWWKKSDPQPKRPKTVPDFISGDRP